MTRNFPQEPSADMRKMARGVREIYLALLGEGFTQPEALAIIGHMMRAAAGGDAS